MIRKVALVAVITLVASLVPVAVAAEQPEWTVTNLGTLPDGPRSVAQDVNCRGEVVGWSDGSTFSNHAALWRAGEVVDLGTLPGGSWSSATRISSRGRIVGRGGTASGETHAVVWQDGNIVDLGTLGGTYSSAYGVSARGQIVGWSATATGENHAFQWQSGIMDDIGLPDQRSAAVDNSERGMVVGTIYPEWPGPPHRPFVWLSGETLELPALPGQAEAGASGASDCGQIVGWSGSQKSNARAVIWTRSGG